MAKEMISLIRARPAALRRLLCMLPRGTKGALLLETMIAVGVFSMVGVAALAGLSTSIKVRARIERDAIAENIVRNQMEFVFTQDYKSWNGPVPYPSAINSSTSAYPPGYAVTVESTEAPDFEGDPDIERITVTVTQHGVQVMVIETARSKD